MALVAGILVNAFQASAFAAPAKENLSVITTSSPSYSAGKLFSNSPVKVKSASYFPRGNLFVTKSAIPVRSRQLLGGTLGDEILRLQFHADFEDIDVTNLVFTAEGPNANSFGSDVERLELYKIGASTPFAVATAAGCGSDPVLANSMCARMINQDLTVAKNANQTISVRPRVRSDVDGAVSGHRFSLTLNPASAISPVRARGFLSSNTLSQNNGNSLAEGEVFIGTATPTADQKISGKLNEVVLSKVMSIFNADPNDNGTAIQSGTQRAIGQFKFRTAPNSNSKNGLNKWTLDGIIFNVNATNVLLGSGSFKIYNKADPTTKSVCTPNNFTVGTFTVTCANLTVSDMNTQIDQGTDTTFVLEANVVNPRVSPSLTSTLQVSLTNFSDITASAFGEISSHLRWIDTDFSAATPLLWIDYPETSINGTSYNS